MWSFWEAHVNAVPPPKCVSCNTIHMTVTIIMMMLMMTTTITFHTYGMKICISYIHKQKKQWVILLEYIYIQLCSQANFITHDACSYIYSYIWTYIHVPIHTTVNSKMFICIHTYIMKICISYIYTYIHTQWPMNDVIYIDVCLCTYIYINFNSYVCIYIYIYILLHSLFTYIYMQIYIYTYNRVDNTHMALDIYASAMIQQELNHFLVITTRGRY